jgi:hypothetical protein
MVKTHARRRVARHAAALSTQRHDRAFADFHVMPDAIERQGGSETRY